MKTPLRLSVLICAVGDRMYKAAQLYHHLNASSWGCFNGEYEILMLMDNRKRSIGLKRQALLDVARGDYVCFVDDDDEVSYEFLSLILQAMHDDKDQAPVFTFPTLCVSKEHGSMRVEHSLRYENEEARLPSFTRKPWFMHPIRRVYAKTSIFPDKNWGEDQVWLENLWPLMASEHVVTHHPLYTYHWNDNKESSE